MTNILGCLAFQTTLCCPILWLWHSPQPVSSAIAWRICPEMLCNPFQVQLLVGCIAESDAIVLPLNAL